MRENKTNQERGQAYTLEALISAMIIVLAVLFAVQSVVITPTTGGAVDRTVQSQLETEAQDALVVANSDGDLSEMLRTWEVDGETATFANASALGDGEYTTDAFESDFLLGELLEERFGSRGHSYNVEAHPRNADGEAETTRLVYQGQPSSDAFTASYTVTLYDDQVAVNEDGETIEDIDGEKKTIRDVHDNYDSEAIPRYDDGGDVVYNVVEIRVIVW